MKHLSLKDHRGGNIEARYYIDGVRVSRDKYEYTKDVALRMDCFHTTGRDMGNGLVRRTNFTNVYIRKRNDGHVQNT